MFFSDVISALQLSVGPAILISGVGLVVLSMTNRFARVVDRTRALSKGIPTNRDIVRTQIFAELKILTLRLKLMRIGISFAVISIFMVALIVINLFLGAVYHLDVAGLIAGLFVTCSVSLIFSLLVFIVDIHLSLKALSLALPNEFMK